MTVATLAILCGMTAEPPSKESVLGTAEGVRAFLLELLRKRPLARKDNRIDPGNGLPPKNASQVRVYRAG